ncbi:MAG: O-antigen ligase family protein [Sarcina sp.]
MIDKVNKRIDFIIYLTLFSIFISDIKIYVPLFAANILYILYLIYTKQLKINLKSWNKSLALFIVWFLINSIIAIFVFKFKLSIMLGIKLVLNLTFLLFVGLLIESNKVRFNREQFLKFLKIIILVNFIQILCIYIKGDLLTSFLSGNLTKSSDTAYTIGLYNNFIGGPNKNIWASKFALMYIVYLFTCVDEQFKKLNSVKVRLAYIVMGGITILLLLSRTAQLSIIIPILFLIFYSIKDIDQKYKNIIYVISTLIILAVLLIFFKKLFHIKFDMTDGGYTRLFIWVKSLENLFENNFIVGEGISSTGYYIQNILGRYESNVHNVFLTTLYEFGIIGLGIYLKFLYDLVKEYFNKQNCLKYIFIIVIPFMIITNLQYLGYDNDLVIFMLLIIILNKFGKEKQDKESC